jgi:hypothetical protein
VQGSGQVLHARFFAESWVDGHESLSFCGVGHFKNAAVFVPAGSVRNWRSACQHSWITDDAAVRACLQRIKLCLYSLRMAENPANA